MMKNRKGTPDIISGLMTGSNSTEKNPASNKTISTVNNKTIPTEKGFLSESPSSYKAVEPASNKTLKPSNLKTCELGKNNVLESDLKEKVTFNLSNSTIQALDDAWIVLRRSKLRDTQRITKTLIVESAVKLVLAELDEKGELSEVYRFLKIQ